MKTKLSTIFLYLFLQYSLFAYEPSHWEKSVVAACLILEASNQGEEGLVAVANVIYNRANHRPEMIYRVVKKPRAFSALNDRPNGFATHVTRASRDKNWRRALLIVEWLYEGSLWDTTKGATHYSRVEEYVPWMEGLTVTKIIGNHKFMK